LSDSLVSRPPYGEGKSRTQIAVAELPSGGPAHKGLPLDSGIPGSSTFTKPVDDIRKPEPKDESIYRVEGPDDLGKDQTTPDSIDHSHASPSFNTGKPSEEGGKTKYPYRDEVPNAHNASFVAELWKLEGARTRIVEASDKVRVASTSDEILTGLDSEFARRAKKCSATLKRADLKNLRWIFSVNCGNGPRAVKIKALPKAQNRAFAKLDLELSCSCPAWQWLGPEYHAKGEAYQLGPLAGTASTPNIRDPERDNRVCKHVAAALHVTRSWEIPKAKMQRAVKKAMKMRRFLKKASDKRACEVCTAQAAIEHQDHGWKRTWETPKGPVTAYVRARGPAEFGDAKYQLRKEGEAWPSTWIPTRDLAGALGRLGFDQGWEAVPVKTQVWLQG
jgi:hypothetical protein